MLMMIITIIAKILKKIFYYTRHCGKHMENENTNTSESDFNSIHRS